MTRPALPLWHPASLLGTWFGTGLLPWVPGTWGSLAAVVIAWPIHHWAGPLALIAAGGAAFAVGWWCSARYMRAGEIKDPGEIVIDEVAAQWLVLALAAPGELWTYLAGFVLFRAFDIAKPWPAGWVDRRIGGGIGVMLDDVFAAVYAGALLILLRWGAGHAAIS